MHGEPTISMAHNRMNHYAAIFPIDIADPNWENMNGKDEHHCERYVDEYKTRLKANNVTELKLKDDTTKTETQRMDKSREIAKRLEQFRQSDNNKINRKRYSRVTNEKHKATNNMKQMKITQCFKPICRKPESRGNNRYLNIAQWNACALNESKTMELSMFAEENHIDVICILELNSKRRIAGFPYNECDD
jgi:hypothetical protein